MTFGSRIEGASGHILVRWGHSTKIAAGSKKTKQILYMLFKDYWTDLLIPFMVSVKSYGNHFCEISKRSKMNYIFRTKRSKFLINNVTHSIFGLRWWNNNWNVVGMSRNYRISHILEEYWASKRNNLSSKFDFQIMYYIFQKYQPPQHPSLKIIFHNISSNPATQYS